MHQKKKKKRINIYNFKLTREMQAKDRKKENFREASRELLEKKSKTEGKNKRSNSPRNSE